MVAVVADRLWGACLAAAWAGRAIVSRPPPPRDLRARLANLTAGAPLAAPITIHWDTHQIPFVAAENDRDLAVGLGLVHAHLRLGQVETMRRVAAGRVAEMAGPLAVDLDRSLRLLDLGRAVPAIVDGLAPATRDWIDGFLAGYNHHLMHAPALPPEFPLLGIGREAWNLHDFLVHARLLSADSSWLAWGRLLRARAALAPAAWQALWRRLLATGAPADLIARPDRAVEQLIARPGRHGSNSIAVAGPRSASGAALIASDPHLNLSLPNPVLLAGAHSPETRVVGLMMPGIPFFPVGRNPSIAWGGTNLYAQTSDLFDVSGEALTTREETIRVRGGKPRTVRLRRSALGPVVSDGRMMANPEPLALRWMGHAPSDEIGPMMAAARARDWEGFKAAIDGFGLPGLNITFAGADGRIGHLRAVRVPRDRERQPDDLVRPPAAAWDMAATVTAAALPHSENPAEGVVVSANEPPPAAAVAIGLFFTPPDRARRLHRLLAERPRLSAADLLRMQLDVLHEPALGGRDFLLAGLGARALPAPAQKIAGLIRAWDGVYDRESTGATAYEFTVARLAFAALRPHVLPAYEAVRQARGLIFEDLAALPAAALAAAIEKALVQVAAKWPRDARWGQVHRLRPGHVLGRLPRIGRHYRAPSLAAAGGNDTVAKAAHGLADRAHDVPFGAAVRHVSDLGDLDANWFRLLGGQDGWFGSENAFDQMAGWNRGADIQVPLNLETVRAQWPHRTVITPL
ncbi:penicillin acylase family protein [Zavarzinia compransoris]|uniref:Penicillin acylase family protein n=1 Tax=Zavarzinia compransoris TaxID=1264899 RepID=A0A317DZ59_9PROT|nr:penicillin acylase family protein [Zavarzinia compransoris]PWR19180.1 penicillin acylase family protein [Zavarzinia compransoris]TDP49196.1 penicillin amidase [Zavarzinia compransoris]